MSRRVNFGVPTVAAAACAVALSLLPQAAAAQTTVVIDTPSTQVGDARIQGGSYANTVFHKQALATKVHPSNASYHRRSVLKFDTHNTVPSGSSVRSATLTLTISKSDPETRKVGVYRLSKTFDEQYATWTTRKSGYRWNRGGGDFAEKFGEATIGATVGARVNVDVTALVQGVVSGKYGSSRYTRVGLMDLGSGSNTSYKEFHSSEASDPALRPALKVVFSSGTTAVYDGGADEDEESAASSPGSVLPSGWQSRDIGAVGKNGSASGSGASFTVKGAGADIWNRADGFHYAYRALSGDGTITARVASLSGVDAWTKIGVMMRGSTAADAAHAFMLVSKGKGLAFQRRATNGASSAHTSGGTGTAPRWVRLTRQGKVITAAVSTNGTSWSTVDTATMSLPSTVLVGLAATSQDTGALATGTFDHVTVSNDVPVSAPAPAPAPADDGGSDGGDDSSNDESPSGSETRLKVLHWNTHHGGRGTDGKYDPVRLADWIAQFNPHIASLNEVDNDSQMHAIVSRLKSKTGVTWRIAFSGRGNLLITRLPLDAKSICTYNWSYPRKAAHLSSIFNGRPVNIWSTHLAVDSGSTRVKETRAMKACAETWSQNRILAGDFNAQASSAEIDLMNDDHYDGWAKAASAGMAVDYKGNSRFGATRNTRIDYVFYSKKASHLVLKRAEVFDTRDSRGYMPSDHKPLMLTFDVR